MNAIAYRREISGLSQKDVAFQLGVTQGAVSQWESELSTPQFDKLPALAKIFGCTIDELFAAERKEA